MKQYKLFQNDVKIAEYGSDESCRKHAESIEGGKLDWFTETALKANGLTGKNWYQIEEQEFHGMSSVSFDPETGICTCPKKGIVEFNPMFGGDECSKCGIFWM